MTDTILYSGLKLDEALTTDSAITRATARLVATKLPVILLEWLESERKRPDFHPIDAMHAMAIFAVQTHATAAANFFRDDAVPNLLDLFTHILESEYGASFLRMRHSLRKMGEAGT